MTNYRETDRRHDEALEAATEYHRNPSYTIRHVIETFDAYLCSIAELGFEAIDEGDLERIIDVTDEALYAEGLDPAEVNYLTGEARRVEVMRAATLAPGPCPECGVIAGRCIRYSTDYRNRTKVLDTPHEGR